MTPNQDICDITPIRVDLVGYLVLLVPEAAGLAALVPALDHLVHHRLIRLLDAAVIGCDEGGVVSTGELDELDELVELAAMQVGETFGTMLTEHDLEQVALVVEPGTTALVLVTEDEWAEPLSEAARSVGGRIVAGERISSMRASIDLLSRPPDLGRIQPDWTELVVDRAAQVRALGELVARGLLSEEEFAEAKARALR